MKYTSLSRDLWIALWHTNKDRFIHNFSIKSLENNLCNLESFKNPFLSISKIFRLMDEHQLSKIFMYYHAMHLPQTLIWTHDTNVMLMEPLLQGVPSACSHRFPILALDKLAIWLREFKLCTEQQKNCHKFATISCFLNSALNASY